MGGPVIRRTLDALARRSGLGLHGDGNVAIEGVGTLAGAGPAQVGFLANPSYRKQLAATRAGAVILRADDVAGSPVPCLVAADPYAAFAKIAALFEPPAALAPGIHASAVVDPAAQ